MTKENIIRFENPKIYFDFTVHDHDDNDQTIWQEVSCNEDIESCMKAYLNNDWEALFTNKVDDVRDIAYVTLDGIRIIAKENHQLEAGVISSNIYAKVGIDLSIMTEGNALKLKQIREILG